MKLTKAQAQEQQQHALTSLKKYCPPGTTIYRKFLYVNRDGDTRLYNFLVIYKGELVCIDWYLAKAFGYRLKELKSTDRGIDTGYDDGQSLIANLSYQLYGEGNLFTERKI